MKVIIINANAKTILRRYKVVSGFATAYRTLAGFSFFLSEMECNSKHYE